MRGDCLCLAVATALLAISFFGAPVAAISSGALGNCDLTPVVNNNGARWPNGCLGKDTWSLPYLVTCNANDNMRWAFSPRPTTDFTLRSGDGASNATDVRSYIPGGTLTEIHLRTHSLDKRVIGFLMYATNGTDPKTKREQQVGSWRVLPASSAGFQVSPTCGNTAVTHNGAEVKPLHSRFWFAAPVGTGTVRFRVLVKEGVQNRGSFWYPAWELTLTEGKVPTPAPQNVPAVWGTIKVNGTDTKVIVKPAVIVPIASQSTEQKVPIISALGQNCADACAEQLPATPFCHRKATVGVSSSAALLSAVGSKVECALPILAGCPYTGAARITHTDQRSTCSFRSQNAALSCPAWTLAASSPVVNAATLFASGTTSSVDRSSPLYVPDVCFTAPTADSQNVCVCTNIGAQQGANPFTVAAIAAAAAGVKPSTQTKTIADGTSAAAARASSAASALSVALLSAVLSLFSSRLGGSKLPLLALGVVALLALASSPVSAHNYMRGLHRASEASVTKPCQTKLGNDPHVQIVAGQPFEMQFTNGHGNTEGQKKTLFVILPAASYDELRAKNITAILKAYLDEAPASAFRSARPDAKMWERQHRRKVGDAIGADMYWEDPKGLDAGDPLFIHVDPVYEEKTHPSPIPIGAKVVQTRVHPSLFEQYGNDRRAVYKNPKWPWIESVDEFINPYNRDNSAPNDFFSHQGDIARFDFPASKGPGDYIAWYSWSGYGDCVDINVMPGTTHVKYRYGRNATELGSKQYAIKVDHCEVRNIPSAKTMMRIVDPVTQDATQCVNDCLALGWTQCSGVQVVRYTNPAGTLPRIPNIPWTPAHWNQTGWNLNIANSRNWPCNCESVYDCHARGCRRTSVAQAKAEGWSLGPAYKVDELVKANANSDIANYPNVKASDYFCFGVKPSRNQDNQVDEDWVLADDAADPVWYSTCYLTVTNGGFLNTPPVQMTPIDYLTTERCVSCDWHQEASGFSLNKVPMWDRGLQPAAANTCTDCSLRATTLPAGVSRAAQLSMLAGTDVVFSGYNATVDKAAYDAAVAAAAQPQPTPGPQQPTDGSGGSDSDGSSTDGGSKTPSGDGAAAGASPSSSSDSLIFGLDKLPSILVLVAMGLGALLLLGGVAFLVHSLRAHRRSSNSDLRRLQEADGFGHTELQANPAFLRL